MRGAIFLDKDGTLLDDVPYNTDPALMSFARGARSGLAQLARLGCPLVVVSNQPGVAEGRFPEAALAGVERRLREMFAGCGAELAGFFYCPHGRERGVCDCRKPQPGLFLRASSQLHIDLQRSWMIGDILDDIEAGRRAGCRTVLLDNGNETEWLPGPLRQPQLFARDVAAAADMIARRWSATEPVR